MLKFSEPWQTFIDLKESVSTLPLIAAVHAGIKPCYDDWIDTNKWHLFQQFLKSLKLVYKIESTFIDMNWRSAIGKERLNTTKFGGSFTVPTEEKRSAYHVLIAKEKANLQKGFYNSWYPIVINNRVTIKPRIDHYWFGISLGYPSCCSKYFFLNNEWNTNSIYAQLNMEHKYANYLCNNLLKNIGFSYIFHIPCSFSCEATINYAEKVRNVLRTISPEYVKLIDNWLKLPILHFNEGCAYLLIEGEKKDNVATYSDLIFLGNNLEEDKYQAPLKSGNKVVLVENKVFIYMDDSFENMIECYSWSKPVNIPLLLKFN